MKYRAVEKSVGCVLAKVFAADGGLVFKEFDANVAVTGLDRNHVVSLVLALVTRGNPE